MSRSLSCILFALDWRVIGLFVLACASVAGEAQAAWHDSSWLYRQRVTISATVTDSDLTAFPCLVKIADVSNPLFGRAQVDGDDLLFTADDGATKLDHEIEHHDAAASELWVWVKIPLLSGSAGTIVYLYYGNAAAGSQENTPGVWSNGFEAVYHLHDDFLDSIGGHHGTNFGSSDAAAQVADGEDFFPSDGYDEIHVGNWNVPGTALTLSSWLKSDDGFVEDDPRAVSKASGTDNEDHVFMLSLYNGSPNENRLRFRLKTGTSDATGTTSLPGSAPNGYLPDGALWYHAAATYDGSVMRIVRDGLSAGSTAKTGAIRENAWEIAIGNNWNNLQAFGAWDGKLDEVRIASVARSLDWLMAEYRNQGSPETYQTLGPEEIEPQIVKRAFQVDGTSIPSGEIAPSGTLVKFLVYVNNAGGLLADVSVQDVLDPAAFAYVPGSLKVDNSVASCAASGCTPAQEAVIFAAADAAAASTDAVDGDAASFDVPTNTIDFGDQNRANGRLDLVAGRVWAAVFTVRLE